MARIFHFEVSAEDPERAAKFYREAFGWEIKKWDSPDANMNYWMVMTGKLINPVPDREYGLEGGLMKGTAFGEKVNAYINTLEIEDLDESRKKVEDAGGKLETDRMTVPGVGYMCYCQDTEGNYFGMMQSDEKAK